MTDIQYRIAIVYPFANLETVPTLTQAAELLARAGYGVDVFTRISSEFPTPAFDAPEIELVPDLPRRQRSGVHRVLPARWSRPVRTFARHRTMPYLCVLAVDPQGLEWTRRWFRWFDGPVAYVSLELLFVDESSSPRQLRWKELERKMGREAPFVVVQDPDRAALLVESTGISPEKVVTVPNAPLGPARRRPSGCWHRRFGLPDEERVVLHAGSIEPWTCVEKIVASTREWPDGFTLVVHTRFSGENSAEVDRLQQVADPDRVRFSLNPVSREAYDDLVDGADIGIAFYEPAGETAAGEPEENIRTIGLSSGKIAYYLRSGLPLVVNDASSVGRLVRDERCGVTVTRAEEIPAALRTLETDIEDCRRRSLTTFDRHFDFARGFTAVLDRLADLARKGNG